MKTILLLLIAMMGSAQASIVWVKLKDNRENKVKGARFYDKRGVGDFRLLDTTSLKHLLKGEKAKKYNYVLNVPSGAASRFKIVAPGYEVHESTIQLPNGEGELVFVLKPMLQKPQNPKKEEKQIPIIAKTLLGYNVQVVYHKRKDLAQKIQAYAKANGASEFQIRDIKTVKNRTIKYGEASGLNALINIVPELKNLVATQEYAKDFKYIYINLP